MRSSLLDHLGLEKVTLLGTSRGGLIAMVLAYAHKSRLNGVILNDIGPVVDAGGLERIMDYVGKEPNFATYAEAAEGLAAVYGDDFPGVIYNRWLVQAEFMWAEQGKETLALRYDPHLRDALVGQAGAGDAPDLWALVRGTRRSATGLDPRGQFRSADRRNAGRDGPPPPGHDRRDCAGPGPCALPRRTRGAQSHC